MIDPRAKYEAALAAFAQPGNRWNAKGGLTYWGKAAGLTADEIIFDARAAGVTDRDADIRRGWEDARPKGESVRGGSYVPRAEPKPTPKRFPANVRNIIGGMDAAKATVDWLRELSPCDVGNLTPEEQTAAFIRAAFHPDELLFAFRGDVGTKGVPGVNLRTAREWLNDLGALRSAGDLVKINPFTGAVGRNKSGQPSYVSQDCIYDYPFALIEFDAMPLPMQYAFWRGFILSHKLAAALVSLTYSGGKSVHGLLHVGCRTLLEWQAVRRRLIDLFAADPESKVVTDEDGKRKKAYPFRADVQALHPLIGTRLPGVMRRDKGTAQVLLYLNPAARADNRWRDAGQTKPTATSKPPCGAAHGMKLCGVCSSFGRCPFAAPDAVRGTTVLQGREVEYATSNF